MAVLIGAIGTSHGPLLATAPPVWKLRAGADRKSATHWYRGQRYDYAGLLAQREPGYGAAIEPAEQERRYQACQKGLDRLAEVFRELKPDLVIIVGNDQKEVFLDDLTPAITVFSGEQINNVPLTNAQLERLPPGIAEAEEGHCPPGGAVYPGAPRSAEQLVQHLTDLGFDISTSTRLPTGDGRQAGIPHAFGFAYCRIMENDPPPSIPLYVNVGVPPNQPRIGRCIALGHALHEAISRLPAELKVVLVASGGMTHFVVDEELDQRVLAALSKGDEAELMGIPEDRFNGNTAEIKSWMPVAFAAKRAGLEMQLVDYVACYRTEAGTGSGMAFAYWKKQE
jgi:hypothetical protein